MATLFVAAMLSFTASAQDLDVSYIVLLNQNGNSAKNFAADVANAGGKVKSTVDEIGVAFVSSSDADFLSTLNGIEGVQDATYSVPVPRTGDTFAEPGPAVDTNHAGEDEFFYPLQWGLDAVNAPRAWTAGATGAGVRVAVLDSGIDHDNFDLVDNINQALSTSFMPCVFGLNCDGAFEDWRVREIDPLTGPFFNHGTHVAGTIAAADNAFGGIGVAPDAEIVAVKVCTEFDTFCFDEAILPGIVYAASNGADLINMSLGGLFDRNPSEICKLIRDMNLGIPCGAIVSSNQTIVNAYRRAFQYAKSQNTTVIVSAGNSALDADNSGSLAFAFAELPHVLGISALGPIGSALPSVFGDAPPAPLAGPDTLAYYSNFGRSIIDFAAPGGNAFLVFAQLDAGQDPFNTFCLKNGSVARCYLFDMVLSNAPGDWFFWAQGTSMAAPHATGVAAILVGLNGGDMSPQQLRTAMKRYSDDLGNPGHDKEFGDGRVNAGAATQ
jgi:subtilisin family serine protease